MYGYGVLVSSLILSGNKGSIGLHTWEGDLHGPGCADYSSFDGERSNCKYQTRERLLQWLIEFNIQVLRHTEEANRFLTRHSQVN